METQHRKSSAWCNEETVLVEVDHGRGFLGEACTILRYNAKTARGSITVEEGELTLLFM
jgi:hypothetical protein